MCFGYFSLGSVDTSWSLLKSKCIQSKAGVLGAGFIFADRFILLIQRINNTEVRIFEKEGDFKSPGACFSKVPKLFGRISGDIILFVSSKRRGLEARNFAFIFSFIPFTTYEKTSFTQ